MADGFDELLKALDHDPWNIMETREIFAPLPPFPWLIEGLQIGPGRITLLCGYADVGKTVVAQSLALSVATGSAVWGVFRPQRTGKVLHLNGEIGAYMARQRYQRLANASGSDVDALVASGNLRLSNYPEARLDDEDFEPKLRDLCAGHVMVIIDSLRAFSGALNENAKEIGIALLMLARVSQATGATIIVLHHNRKPSQNDVGGDATAISGSSSILGGADCAFVMKAADGIITVNQPRSPIGQSMAEFGLLFEDITQGADRRWGLRVVHLEPEQVQEARQNLERAKQSKILEGTLDKVLELLRMHAGVFQGGQRRMRESLGVKSNDLTAALRAAEERGLVEDTGTYHAPVYRLTDRYPGKVQ